MKPTMTACQMNFQYSPTKKNLFLRLGKLALKHTDRYVYGVNYLLSSQEDLVSMFCKVSIDIIIFLVQNIIPIYNFLHKALQFFINKIFFKNTFNCMFQGITQPDCFESGT